MAKDKVVEGEEELTSIDEVAPVPPTKDYSTMTYDQLLAEVGKAWDAKDLKLMGKLSSLATKAEVSVEKAKKDALLAELVAITRETLIDLYEVITKKVEDGRLDGAEGVWFAYDFGEKVEPGINPACRLVKSGRKASSEGGGSAGASSYKAGLPPSEDMLKQVGNEVMFAEDTTVTIDKVEQVIPAGTTYREAYDKSTNGGWRNRCRMALGKKAGLIS